MDYRYYQQKTESGQKVQKVRPQKDQQLDLYTRGKFPGVIHSLLSDRRCDAGCADGLLAARVPPPPSGDTGEQRDPKEAAT